MIELEGADAATVDRIASERGSLPVRLAMLGRASLERGKDPLWWGYPPGVFISYKWDDAALRDLVTGLAGHVRRLGYRAFLDLESLDEAADAYFEIPQFIVSLQDCTFYLLLLTRRSADILSVRTGVTSWIYDEFQHAVRLANSGRLVIVPVLLEPEATIDIFPRSKVLDLTSDRRDFSRLESILTPAPPALDERHRDRLAHLAERFDDAFLAQQWRDSLLVLSEAAELEGTFDVQFRRLLHSIYTADQAGVDASLRRLLPVVGEAIVNHVYAGYCETHGIPNRLSTT